MGKLTARYQFYPTLNEHRTILFSDDSLGAVFDTKEELWFPFRFFDDGSLDVWDKESFLKPSTAFDRAMSIFT